MSKTKKEYIIESIQKMDCEMLDILLEDHLTYDGAKKEVFLKKLEMSFSKFRLSGDTCLQAFKGFCDHEDFSDEVCKGYSFVGTHSKNHLDLIFDESESDVSEIYYCDFFEIDDKSIQIKNSIKLNIYYYEKADYCPSIDFLLKIKKSEAAYDELFEYGNILINKEIFNYWLDKHLLLFESFKTLSIVSLRNEFCYLYYLINGLNESLQSNNISQEALKDFQNINQNEEKQLLKWLTKYEKEGYELVLFDFKQIDLENPENTKYFDLEGLKIMTSDFKYICKFKFYFDKYFYVMLEKYTTFSREDESRYCNECNELEEYIYSLSYHLKQRGIII